jgi:hypothetical protein
MKYMRMVLLLTVVITGLLSAQPKVAVFEFQPVAVDPTLAPVLATLLRGRLTDIRAFTVIVPPAGEHAYTTESAVEIAKSLGAEKALVGDITGVGGKRLIAYRMVDVATGAITMSDRATVLSESELDDVSARIATALKSGGTYSATMTPSNVTQNERGAPASRQPFGTILFTTGYTFPFVHNFPYNPGNMLFTLDAAITYETPSALAMGEMGVMRGTYGLTGIHFDLLAHRVFGNGDVAPFLGGGLGVHRLMFRPDYGTSLPARDDDGLELTASGGALLFRSYYFRFIGNARASVILAQRFGPVVSGGIHFGLTSPGTNEGEVRTPPGLLYVTLAGMFVTGLIVALNH